VWSERKQKEGVQGGIEVKARRIREMRERALRRKESCDGHLLLHVPESAHEDERERGRGCVETLRGSRKVEGEEVTYVAGRRRRPLWAGED
jgi:hypothetical protein